MPERISVARGFRPFGHVGFELISQDWAQGTRRLASAMACSRFLCLVLGIPMYGHHVFELSSRASEICTSWLRLVTIPSNQVNSEVKIVCCRAQWSVGCLPHK